MRISDHVKEHIALDIAVLKNSKNIVVGRGGHSSSIESAVTRLGSRWAKRLSDAGAEPPTQSLTFTNNSATVTKASAGTGIAFNTNGSAWGVGGFLTTNGTKYHKIKKIIDANNLELWGPWTGSTGDFSVQPYYLERANLWLLPGDYELASYALPPGINLLGADKNSVNIAYDRPFTSVGENFLYNLTIGPVNTFGAMDSLGAGFNSTELGHGCGFYASNIRIICGSYNGAHNGGNLYWPVVTGGISSLVDSDIILAGNSGSLSTGGESGVRSIVHWKNVRIFNDSDFQAVSGGVGLAALDLSYNSADYLDVYLDDIRVLYQDIGKNPSFAMPIGAILVNNPNSKVYISGLKSETRNSNTSAAATEIPTSVYVVDGEVHIENSRLFASGQVTGPANAGVGLDVYGGTVNVRNSFIYGLVRGIQHTGGTVNLHGCDVTSGGTGIYVNAAGATCNVRAGSRIEGTTNSINCAAGTVNVSGNADLIGATTGAGTINSATAT